MLVTPLKFVKITSVLIYPLQYYDWKEKKYILGTSRYLAIQMFFS